MVLLLVMCAVEMDIAIGITTKSDIAMNEFAYVVSLAGKHVFHDWSIQCIIKHMDDLDKVRAIIKEKHNVEFENFLHISLLIIGSLIISLIIEIFILL